MSYRGSDSVLTCRLYLLLLCLTVNQLLYERKELDSYSSRWMTATLSSSASPPRVVAENILRPLCLEIVRQALLTDIMFEHVAGHYSEHPHMGAVGPNGEAAYRLDTRALRRNPPHFTISDADIQAFCHDRDAEYQMLTEHVVIDHAYEQAMTRQLTSSLFQARRRPQLLCLIYTTSANHHRIQNIRETWAQKCDGFFAASNVTDPSVNAVSILHEGPEAYNNMWQKVRSIWSYVYDNYFDEYDWFHLGGDDMYLIVENLQKYLECDELQAAQMVGLENRDSSMQVPLYLGKRMKNAGNASDLFNTGGPGYTLNRAALKRLVVHGLPHYYVDKLASAEDVLVGKILKQVANILPYDTKDELGRERYMHYYPSFHYPYKKGIRHWHDRYSMDPLLEGYNHSSTQSIAFHYIRDAQMKRLHFLLYHKCPKAMQDSVS